MDREKTNRIATRICDKLLDILAGRPSVTVKEEERLSMTGESCAHYLSLARPGEGNLVLQELIRMERSGEVLSFSWIFGRLTDGGWSVDHAEKNGVPVPAEYLFNELDEAAERLLNPWISRTPLMPAAVNRSPAQQIPLVKRGYQNIMLLIASAVLVFGLFITLFVSTLQYFRMTRIVDRLDASIFYSAETSDRAAAAMSDRLDILNTEIEVLKAEVQREKEAFEFNRLTMSMDIRKQAEGLPRGSYARRKAYEYIAGRIENAATYGEIVYEISRLPQNNTQAATLLSTEKDRVIPLSAYIPAVAGMTYPVRLDNKPNNGEDFIITSDFSDSRLSPLGTGGYFPHHAVDIINLGNIVMIGEDSTLERDAMHPGAVVSCFDGRIIQIGFNDIYGWYAEVMHDPTPELKKKYRGITSWSTYYAHLETRGAWEVGNRVAKNEKLGDIGNTGTSTGPHLHFEVRIYRPRGGHWSPWGWFDRIEPYRIAE
jgi:murein DD-endopeptidase MepM/ murein hydrolase activator NlpD